MLFPQPLELTSQRNKVWLVWLCVSVNEIQDPEQCFTLIILALHLQIEGRKLSLKKLELIQTDEDSSITKTLKKKEFLLPGSLSIHVNLLWLEEENLKQVLFVGLELYAVHWICPSSGS